MYLINFPWKCCFQIIAIPFLSHLISKALGHIVLKIFLETSYALNSF